MRISARVKPGSKVEAVEKTGEGEYIIRVKAPAKEGRANEAVIEALSEYFDIAKSRITITHGAGGRVKMIDIS